MQSRVHLSDGIKQLHAVDHPHLVLTNGGTMLSKVFPQNVMGDIWCQYPWNPCTALHCRYSIIHNCHQLPLRQAVFIIHV